MNEKASLPEHESRGDWYIREHLALLEREGFAVAAYDVPHSALYDMGLDELPEGVAIMGGSARAIAHRVVCGEDARVRDIDLVALDGLYDLEVVDLHGLSREYMPDDYTYGHGIDVVTLDSYFATRDLTINEVIVAGDKLLISHQGRDDLRNKIVRPTEYESEGWEYGIGPKLAVKAQLMAALFEQMYGKGKCRGFDERAALDSAIGFYLALGLSKALQYGRQVTQGFLRRMGIAEDTDIVELARSLSEEYQFRFRGSDMADVVNGNGRFHGRVDEEWSDLPDIYGVKHAHAVHLLGEFAGRLPAGVSADEW